MGTFFFCAFFCAAGDYFMCRTSICLFRRSIFCFVAGGRSRGCSSSACACDLTPRSFLFSDGCLRKEKSMTLSWFCLGRRNGRERRQDWWGGAGRKLRDIVCIAPAIDTLLDLAWRVARGGRPGLSRGRRRLAQHAPIHAVQRLQFMLFN